LKNGNGSGYCLRTKVEMPKEAGYRVRLGYGGKGAQAKPLQINCRSEKEGMADQSFGERSKEEAGAL